MRTADVDYGEPIPDARRGALRRGFALLPRILPYVRPYKWLAVGAIILTVLLAVVALAQPWPLAFVIDSVVSGEQEVPRWVTRLAGSEQDQLVLFGVVSMMVVTALAGGLRVIADYVTTKLDQKMTLDFRSDLFEHTQRLSLGFHDESHTGILMYRINNQARAVGAVMTQLPTLAQSALTVLGMGYVAYRIDGQLALLALAVVPFVFLSTNFYTNRIEPELYRVRGLEGMNLAIVHEAMQMLRVVVTFGRERHEFGKFRRQGESAVEARVRLTVKQTLFALGVSLTTAAGTAAVLGVGAHRVINGSISPGELLVVIAYIAAVYAPLEQLSKMLAGFQQQFIAIEHAISLLDTPPEVTERADARVAGRGAGRIEVRGVSFDYPTRPGALKDVSFTVEPGETLAIVGPTGAGKSTLVGLLPRLYDPSGGVVLVDGEDVRDLTIESVRAQFSIVMQEPLLFSGTIRDNIRYGDLAAEDDQVRESARLANAHRFIMKLPGKYNTKLGERGTMISGGERQRIAIARAFLRDAPILILDEPTSAIDSRTEQGILDTLDRLMEERTTILIAHRLSTVRHADKIIVLDNGQVVQQGTFDELRAEDGLFNLLWDMQAGQPDEPRTEDVAVDVAGDAAEQSAATDSGEWVDEAGTAVAPNGDAFSVPSRPHVVLLGDLSRNTSPGRAWVVRQYAAGFSELGFDVFYVEDHGRPSSSRLSTRGLGRPAAAADYLAGLLPELGLEGCWAYRPSLRDGRCFGLAADELARVLRDAELVLNLHGATDPSPEHVGGGRLVYLGTEPGLVELRLNNGNADVRDHLAKHDAWFTWALNAGKADCELPVSDEFPMTPTPPPVMPGQWIHRLEATRGVSTIATWNGDEPVLRWRGEQLSPSERRQIERLIDLPQSTSVALDLAVTVADDRELQWLAQHGWAVQQAADVAGTLESYQAYLQTSAGHLSAGNDMDVALRTGRIVEHAAFSMMSGRPTIIGDNGIGRILPTGEGLLTFRSTDEAAAAIERVAAEPARHREAAFAIAVDFFRPDFVVRGMLERLGIGLPRRARAPSELPAPRIPTELDLVPVSRRPVRFSDVTHRWLAGRQAPSVDRRRGARPRVSIVVVVWNALDCVKLCIESVLANTAADSYELVIVDNGSEFATRRYLTAVAARNNHVELTLNEENLGFAAAVNQGIARSRGGLLVLLNSDTVVTPGWLDPLRKPLKDDTVGLAGPRTNRSGTAAEIPVPYRTYGELLRFARDRRKHASGETQDIDVAVMFCTALRRSTFDAVGPLDEQFGIGMFEDDDYSRRVRDAGLRVVCADDAFVHHVGEASLGTLAPSGELGALFHRNRRRFETKWGVVWSPHARRVNPEHERMRRRLAAMVLEHVPSGATALVVSRGDDGLLQFERCEAWHFPRDDDGQWTGYHPADDEEAIDGVERAIVAGATHFVLPASASWWIDRYARFAAFLREQHELVAEVADVGWIFSLSQSASSNSAQTDAASK